MYRSARQLARFRVYITFNPESALMKRKGVALAVQNVIEKAPFSLTDLADKAGVSYDSLRSWAIGRRTPREATRRKLVAGLRKKADELERLADELESAPTPPE
jgi:transcriptional regulator with XRE-family HTH domain